MAPRHHAPGLRPSHRHRRRALTALTAAGLALAALPLAGCGSSGPAATSSDTATKGTVTLVTYDSWAMSSKLVKQFEAQTGYKLQVTQSGGSGELVNKLILTKDAPIGDAVFGIDNTFATRAIDGGILTPYTPPAQVTAFTQAATPASSAVSDAPDGSGDLTPVDQSDVCVNVDHTWFAKHGVAEPTGLDDLAKPEYAKLLEVENPSTSSPGLAFLLATIGAKGTDPGTGWTAYWKQLKAGGVGVADSWDDAYNVDFTAMSDTGTRPLVVSYSSSPPSTIPKGGTTPTTGALLDTCFRQIEYAGVLKGAKNPAGAKAVVNWLLSTPVQDALPDNLWVYPISPAATLPASWAKYGPLAPSPYRVSPSEIAAHRNDWIQTWTDTVIG